MKSVSLVFTTTLLFTYLLAAEPVHAVVRPHAPRQGPNIVQNPEVDGGTHWDLSGTLTVDPTVSRTPGSGSFKLTAPYSTGGMVKTARIRVKPGVTYTCAFYMKSDSWPCPILCIMPSYYNASGFFIENRLGSRQAVTDMGIWQECVLFFTPVPGDAYIVLNFYMTDMAAGINGTAWADDFYFGEGVGFEQPPSPKKAFDGAQVRVDELGNFELWKNNAWSPFFPLCIYTDGKRADWSIYSKQGFNCNIWATNASAVQKAKNAVSEFNPDGMLSGFQIAQYTWSKGWAYGDTADLTAKLREIKDMGLMDRILLYYWDNELAYNEWAIPNAVTTIIKQEDKDSQGRRLHPIYALNGNEGIARLYNNDRVNMIDITGDYVEGDAAVTGGTGGSRDCLVIMDNIQGQQSPAVFGQINAVSSKGELRTRIYKILILGGKAIGYYRDPDYLTKAPIESLEWWPEFPAIRREIDLLLPLIRQPHWTNWKAAVTENSVILGKRDYNGEGYILVANQSDNPITPTFTVEDFPYGAETVRDYFTGDVVASFSGNSFRVSLPAWGTAVYRLSLQKTGINSTPSSFSLGQNFPNPFNPSTTISFHLPVPANVRLDVFDIRGAHVKTLLNRPLAAGPSTAVWDGRNQSGIPAASGIYFYRMKTATAEVMRKMVLLR